MATYKELVGQKVTKVSSNPSDPITGQMWYNSTTGNLKGIGLVEAWVSSTPISTARAEVAGAGDQTAGMVFGGTPPSANSPSETNGDKTEEYNGSGWTTGGTKNNKTRAQFGFGTQTAAVACGGYRDPAGYFNGTEEYDGSSWTNTNNYPTNISNGSGGGCGTQTAGFNASGYGGSGYVTTTAEYDGSSWTAGNAYPISKQNVTQLGIQTAALSFGGHPGATEVFTYDGTNFAATTSLPGDANQNGRAGTQTSAIIFTGRIAATTNATTTQKWDGSTWTTGASVAIPRGGCGNGGATKGSAFVAGGSPPSAPAIPTAAATEEYNESTNTISAAAWASSNNLNTGRNAGAGFGIQTAAVMTTGNEPPESNATEEYDGSSWTSVTNYPISKRFTAASGTLTSGLVAGGSPAVATVNKYDGTNWTAANSLPTSTDGGVMFGTQTASVYSVGRNPSATTTTYEFDGTNWTAGGAAGTARYFLASSGTLTAGLMFGGQAPGPSIKSETEEYDGTSWSESGDLGTGRYGVGGSSAGTQTDTIAFAGNNPAVVLTEGYDGTVWSTRPSMATARRFISGAGTATAALGFGGNPPNTSTEEFTGQVSTLNIADFTTS